MPTLYTPRSARPLSGRYAHLPQRGYERLVGLENILGRERRRRHPLKPLGVERAGLSSEALDDPQRELHVAILIGMREAHEGTCCQHFDAELLAQLAPQGTVLALARVHLAAGELPAPGERLAGRPLCNQYPACVIEQRGCDHEHRGPEGTGGHRLVRIAYSTLESAPWQGLYFFPEPHGQGSVRPTLRSLRTKVPESSGGGGGAPAGGAPRAPAPRRSGALGAAPGAGSAAPPPASAEAASACCACSARISRR